MLFALNFNNSVLTSRKKDITDLSPPYSLRVTEPLIPAYFPLFPLFASSHIAITFTGVCN